MRIRRRIYGLPNQPKELRSREHVTPGIRDAFITVYYENKLICSDVFRVRLATGLPSAAREEIVSAFARELGLKPNESIQLATMAAKRVKKETRKVLKETASSKPFASLYIGIYFNAFDDCYAVVKKRQY